jgi:hypothetical protein
MKRTIIAILLLFYFIPTFSQTTVAPAPLARADYLAKSKRQKTTGFILLGAGVTLIAILAPGNTDLDAVGILAPAAGACILGSIPFFIASGKNKKRAMNASAGIEMERLDIAIQKITIQPAITLRVNF